MYIFYTVSVRSADKGKFDANLSLLGMAGQIKRVALWFARSRDSKKETNTKAQSVRELFERIVESQAKTEMEIVSL